MDQVGHSQPDHFKLADYGLVEMRPSTVQLPFLAREIQNILVHPWLRMTFLSVNEVSVYHLIVLCIV